MNNLNSESTFQPQTYTISNAFIKRTKNLYLMTMIMLPLGILFTLFLTLAPISQLDDSNFPIFFIIGITTFIELEIFIISRIMLKKISENTLTIDTDFIQRKSKVLEPPLDFKFIKKLIIKYNPNGSVNYIDVTNSSQTIRLYGFENMEEIAQILKTHLPHAEVKEHTYKFDYNSPVLFIIIFLACTILFSFADNHLSLPLDDIVPILMGIWMLFGKPISKAQGNRFRILEIVCSILIIGGITLSYLT